MRESRKIIVPLKILPGIESQAVVRYTNEADHSAHWYAYLSRQLISIT